MRLTTGVFLRLVKSVSLISLILLLGACSTISTDSINTGISSADINYRDGLTINYGLATLAAGDNLLVNESFKRTDGWSSCGDASNYTIAQGSLNTTGTSCVYQTIPASAAEDYTLVCNSSAGSSYSEIALSMLDAAYNPISEDITEITGKDTADITITSTAPAGTVFAAVTLYSEGVSSHSQCLLSAGGSVTPVDPTPVDPTPVDPTGNELLANPGFDTDSDWFNCGNAANSKIVAGALTLSGDSACIFQTVEATADTTYNLACDSASSADYSNVTLSMLDVNYSALKAETIPVTDTTAQPSVLASLKSTDATRYVAVTIYSEGPAVHEGCSLTSGTPANPAPVDPAPIDPAPVDPAPVDPAPVDPVDPAPVDPAPVDPAPVDPAPVDPAPVDPAPVDPNPGANSLLVNSSFDDTDGWTVCAGSNQGNYGIGTGNFVAGGTACAFQTLPLTGASEYTLVCNALSDALTANISLSILDANYNTLTDVIEPITSASLESSTLKISPVTGGAFVSVTLYNDEGSSTIADCGLVAN